MLDPTKVVRERARQSAARHRVVQVAFMSLFMVAAIASVVVASQATTIPALTEPLPTPPPVFKIPAAIVLADNPFVPLRVTQLAMTSNQAQQQQRNANSAVYMLRLCATDFTGNPPLALFDTGNGQEAHAPNERVLGLKIASITANSVTFENHTTIERVACSQPSQQQNLSNTQMTSGGAQNAMTGGTESFSPPNGVSPNVYIPGPSSSQPTASQTPIPSYGSEYQDAGPYNELYGAPAPSAQPVNPYSGYGTTPSGPYAPGPNPRPTN